MVLFEFFKRLKELKLDAVDVKTFLWTDELFHFQLSKGNKHLSLRLVEVTSGHDKFWFEVSGAPPVRFNDLNSLFNHLADLLPGDS